MKLLVIQEQHFTRMPNCEVWVDEQSDSKFWERYLSVFEEVVVCARFIHVKKYDTKHLIQSDHKNVSFIELPNFRGVAGLLRNISSVQRIMRKAINDCDRIIFRAPSPISMIAYSLVKCLGKPYAVELMNNPYTHFSPAAMHNFYQPILRWFIVKQTKSLCKNANGVSYVTEKILQELYPSRARLHGESNRYFEGNYSTISLQSSRYSFDIWSSQKPECVILIHTGKMQDNRKGQDIFIETLAILSRKGYNVRGILVGDGDMRPVFEKLGYNLGIADRLKFTGWRAGFDAVQIELKKAQFAVFPSKGEGLPRSIIEAMSQGLLCFGTSVDGIKELLDDDLLIPNCTSECFANHIEQYLCNWERVLEKRKIQFDVACKYENSILEKRRYEFYMKLRNCIE